VDLETFSIVAAFLAVINGIAGLILHSSVSDVATPSASSIPSAVARPIENIQ
jgi:hypothetical protein